MSIRYSTFDAKDKSPFCSNSPLVKKNLSQDDDDLAQSIMQNLKGLELENDESQLTKKASAKK